MFGRCCEPTHTKDYRTTASFVANVQKECSVSSSKILHRGYKRPEYCIKNEGNWRKRNFGAPDSPSVIARYNILRNRAKLECGGNVETYGGEKEGEGVAFLRILLTPIRSILTHEWDICILASTIHACVASTVVAGERREAASTFLPFYHNHGTKDLSLNAAQD